MAFLGLIHGPRTHAPHSSDSSDTIHAIAEKVGRAGDIRHLQQAVGALRETGHEETGTLRTRLGFLERAYNALRSAFLRG